MRAVPLLVAVALAGCATSPSKIQPAYVSPTKYRSFTCEQIAQEQALVDAKAADLHKKLKRKADTDAFEATAGALLVWPMLLFLSGGDGPEAAEYAQLKGERDALASAAGSCRQTVAAGDDRPLSGGVQLLPAKTASGYCVVAPKGYIGTGGKSSPAITSGQPRCEELTSR